MRKTMKKLAAVLLVVILSFSVATPVLAGPSSNRATVADLEVIVRGYVERHVDTFLGDGSLMDSALTAFEVFVTELAVSTIHSILLDTEGLLDFTSPLISAAINDAVNSALAQIGPNVPDVDLSDAVEVVLRLILETGIIETILSIQLVNDILQRAAEYAVADAIDYAMGQLVFIPGDADVLELSRRYANEIAGFNVVPFPLTRAFLGTSLANQGLLVGHSLDLVNPFWAIEIHSHGFLNLQRTYRVTGWQRTPNTNALDTLVNIIPGVNLDVNSFLSIENYVLTRLGVDVIGGTYDGITNFDVDAFMAALPGVIWAATQRAVVDVITERVDAYIEHILGLIEYEIRKGQDWLQSEIDSIINTIRGTLQDAVDAILPVRASAQEAFDNILALIDKGVEKYFDTEARVIDAITRLEDIISSLRRTPVGFFRNQTFGLANGLLERLEVRHDEIIENGCPGAWRTMIAELNSVFGLNLSNDMSAEEVLAAIAVVLARAA